MAQDGKIKVMLTMSPDARRELKVLAAKNDVSMSDMVARLTAAATEEKKSA